EHPFLMKGLQTASLSIAEKANQTFSSAQISEEFALRFPTVLFGSLTILLIFLLVKELFGSTIGFISASFWAVDPNAIGFDRIAKEDSFLLFFFLLANVFWLRSQTVAEKGEKNPHPLYWASAISFGAMIASKYLVHILGIFGSYYNIFQGIKATKWRLGKIKWLMFFAIMGIAFVAFNPTILLPETWREMLIFAGEKRIGHDAYEFAGTLYQNKMTSWLSGVPWTFYYVFILVKTPILTLIFFLIGLPFVFQKKLGDGRYFLLFWAFFFFFPFTVMGGKFVRYFTLAQPIIFIVAAIGFYSVTQFFKLTNLIKIILFVGIFVFSFWGSVAISPNYRLFTNVIGNGNHYFPHDEFYDLSSREAVEAIGKRAQTGVAIASETPYLLTYYAEKTGRADLQFVSLSDKEKVRNLKVGDFILVAAGRRYFSNDAYLKYLRTKTKPTDQIIVHGIVTVDIYQLDEVSLKEIQRLAQ
ncbi:MAG TPA: glycosyltransferase family 39 protein, partial [Pyrinomonadaceae bacterium]|nr:glycosyltransferase family 39 protein [Pyrinomonadaceae bacterium]